jgi:hypothetical protein
MTLQSVKNLSAFGESAIKLDGDFSELERLSGELDRLPIESESGLERARLLMARFSECSQRIGSGIQLMASSLEESRARAENAVQIVSVRAAVIQTRQQETERMLERFQALGEMVRKITTAVSQIQKPAGMELSDEERTLLMKHMPELNSQLEILINEAGKLKNDAQTVNMKTLERNADSLQQSLQAVRQKLNVFAEHTTTIDTYAPRSPELH